MVASLRNKTRALAFAAVGFALVVSGCGYGALKTGDESSSEDSERGAGSVETPSVSEEAESAPAEACLDQGPPDAGDAPARLLTTYEYRNSVRDLLGYTGNVTEGFPAENKVAGFENNADAHVANKLQIRKYLKAAETISERVTDKGVEAALPCDPSVLGETDCAEQFVRSFLRRAFRRPPTDDEIDDFGALFQKGRSKWGFADGIRLVIQAVLQSPQFLYRLKLVDPKAEGPTRPLDGYEVATRLSYFLWATTPDERLLEAARTGRLQTADQIDKQVRRMLDDPRAKNAVYQFHRQWLHLDGLHSVVKDAGRFPKFEPKMTEDWRESMREFVLNVYFSKGGDVEKLLTSPKIFLTDELAPVYGKKPRARGMEAYDFDADHRSGLLTQPSLMALLANANQSSPIRRGVWVRERLLCQQLPPPPADANITPPDPDPNASTRERFRQHTANPQCAGCHQMIDPIGFGFSHYDSMGRWRSRDNGSQVDATGRLARTGEHAIEGEYDGAIELADRLASSRTVKRCIAKRWFTYAMGRPPTRSERCALQRVQMAFDEAGGDFEELLVSIATSEAFLHRKVATNGDSR